MYQSSVACDDCSMTIEYLGPAEVAAYVARKHGKELAAETIRSYASKGRMPVPDARIGGNAGWLPETIDRWVATRPGRGARTDLRK